MKLISSFKMLVGISALASISIFGIPLTWVAMVGIILLGVQYIHHAKLLKMPLLVPFFIISLWAIILNIIYWQKYQIIFPITATTPYSLNVALRYLNILSFIGFVVITLRICQAGYKRLVISTLVNLGVVVSLYAIYVLLHSLQVFRSYFRDPA